MPHSISTLVRKYLAPGAEAPTVPVLIWEEPPVEQGEIGSSTHTDIGAQKPKVGEPLVFFLEKREKSDSPIPMAITVGRADASDVLIEHKSVSRLHAWLQQEEDTGRWVITDAESKNGTWVDTVRLPKMQRVPLVDRSTISFGHAKLRFFLPASLLVELKRRAGQG